MRESLTGIIPAGGEATRLRPHSLVEQKPVMPMGHDRRLIDGALDLAKGADRTFVIVPADDSRAERLRQYVDSRENLSVLQDREPNGAAALIDFADILFEVDPEGSSLILPADHVIEGLSLLDFHEHHLDRGVPISILTVDQKPYGQYVQATDGMANDISSDANEDSVSSAGIYIASNRHLLEWARTERAEGWDGGMRSFLGDIVAPAVTNNEAAIYHLTEDGYWDDAGTIYRYHFNNMRLSKGENVVANEASVGPESRLVRCVILGQAAIDATHALENSVVSGDGVVLNVSKVEI